MDLQLLTDYERTRLSDRQPLPDAYLRLGQEELDVRIAAAKAALGDRLVILGHHYQRDEVIKFADRIGDSLRLAQYAASQHQAENVIFCGVHFMAESADVLSAPGQRVILPDLAAGCSMADMAAIDQLEICWAELTQLGVTGVIPVTYINSTAAIKGFCGEHGGIVCTSSNAAKVMRWAWERGERILFLPDQHLGRNTAYKMGVPLDQMVVWDPHEVCGGRTVDEIRDAKMILWKGHCSVHERFTVAQITRIREQHPGVRVIVHPEVPWEVVQAADDSGSTEYIIRQVTASAPGSVWAVGTEIHLVNRLANDVKADKTVLSLDQFGCLCSTMFRVSPNHLLWIMEELIAGRVHNVVKVPERVKHWSKVALDRMLTII